MEQERFMKLSELQKGDVVRSPQFVEGVSAFRASRHNAEWVMLLTHEKNLKYQRDTLRGNALFAVTVIEERTYSWLLFFKKKFYVVELRQLNVDGSYNYERESTMAYPRLDCNHPDFFVEVVGHMNFNWSDVIHATTPHP